MMVAEEAVVYEHNLLREREHGCLMPEGITHPLNLKTMGKVIRAMKSAMRFKLSRTNRNTPSGGGGPRIFCIFFCLASKWVYPVSRQLYIL
jgi:hypothetical protein